MVLREEDAAEKNSVWRGKSYHNNYHTCPLFHVSHHHCTVRSIKSDTLSLYCSYNPQVLGYSDMS